MMKSVCSALAVLLLAAPAMARDPDPANGEKLFKRYCAGCHGADGRGGGDTFMPHIENLTKAGYIEFLPDDYLIGVITEGGPSVGKSSYMPAWGGTISADDILDIVAHIRTLSKYQ